MPIIPHGSSKIREREREREVTRTFNRLAFIVDAR